MAAGRGDYPFNSAWALRRRNSGRPSSTQFLYQQQVYGDTDATEKTVWNNWWLEEPLTEYTQTATSRVAKSFTKDQTATARIIKTGITKTQSATANIVVAGTFTASRTATARISKSITKTQDAISRISKNFTKTQPATANITVATVNTKDQPALARIQTSGTKTQTGTARIHTTTRFWVGGSGDWSDTSHWAYISGGSGIASVPTLTDNVYIDDSSGFGSGGTITIDTETQCKDFIVSTSHALTITGVDYGMSISGSVHLGNNITLSIESGITLSTSGTATINTNGSVFNDTYSEIQILSGTYILLSHITTTNSLYIESNYGAVAFDANDYNITADSFYAYSNNDDITISLGSGTHEFFALENYSWKLEERYGNVININAETSTIKINNNSAHDDVFTGLGKTYNTVWIAGTSTEITKIVGSNTFNSFNVNNGLYVGFEPTTTNTFNTIDISGASGSVINVDSVPIIKNNYYWSYDPADFDVIGSELISNGTFTGNANGWTLGDGWSYGSNAASHTGDTSATNYDISQSINITPGKYYLITFDITASSNDWGAVTSLGGFTTAYNTGAVGTYSVVVLTQDTSSFAFSQNNTVTVDNISVKEVEPKQYTLYKSSGTVTGDYLEIKKSNVTGGASWYTGTNFIDGGDNNGWIFTGPVTRLFKQSANALICLAFTQTATARITANQTKTQTATGAVQNTASTTQQAQSRIAKSYTLTQTATATVVSLRSSTQTAGAYIYIQRIKTTTLTVVAPQNIELLVQQQKTELAMTVAETTAITIMAPQTVNIVVVSQMSTGISNVAPDIQIVVIAPSDHISVSLE